jgi:DNA-directed RNA polymerase specialized sigma24 family protein
MLGDRYIEGATIYQLAKEFGICRNTVSQRLKKAGITMRRQSPGSELINSMVGLSQSGLSLAEVGDRVGTSPGTVHRYLLVHGV